MLPKFRRIVDTTSTCYCNVGSYLTELLNQLTQNEFIIRDSFDAANKIKSIPPEVFNDGYIFAPFDLEWLFMNVPLQRTINIILDHVYNDKFTATQLKKQTLKKLIKDTCSKTVFSSNNKLYQQIDGGSMGNSLRPLLANIIMTEMKKTIIKKFIDDRILFYGCYVNGTLVVIKREHLKLAHEALNIFNRNLNFTVDTFNNVAPHFLDIEIHPDVLSDYCKDTNTGQYIHYNSYSPWCYKISSFVHRAVNICDKNKLQAELARIKDLIAWNGFPKRIGDAIINNKLKGLNVNNINNRTNNDFETIWIKIPYLGDKGEQLLKSLKTKSKHHLTKELKFRIIQSTQKLHFYTNMKDQIPKLTKSHVVYQFDRPGCNDSYISKTERNLCTRTEEHACSDEESAIYDPINNCSYYSYIENLFRFNNDSFDKAIFSINSVQSSTKVIDSAHDWNILLIKEALLIKQKMPKLNNGLKASKDLKLLN